LQKEILKKLGNPLPQNFVYTNVKLLLERIAPLMIDVNAIEALVAYVEEALQGKLEERVKDAGLCGMRLLLLLSQVFPGSFNSEAVFNQFIAFVKEDDDIACDLALQILTNIGRTLERNHPEIHVLVSLLLLETNHYFYIQGVCVIIFRPLII
jgi:sister-chromatid-cohesion protein PDS5